MEYTATRKHEESIQSHTLVYSGNAISEAMQEKARFGYWPSKVPLGYKHSREDHEKLEINAEVGPLIREAFYCLADSRHSLRKTLELVTQRGLLTKTGEPLSSASLWHILKNPFYCGWLRYKGELIVGNHEPLISKDCFERVQHNLAERRRN